MDRTELLKTVNDIFIDVLDNNNIVLTDDITADDVDNWNSLNHIHLVVCIEKQFTVKFKSQEIQEWNNVGEMLDCIELKLNVAI
jgi:acyl carrier protein